WSPQVKQSAGKRKGNNSTGRGNPYLGAALGEALSSAGRTQSFPGARYRRLARRMPTKKALVATGNSMLTIIQPLLADPQAPTTTACRLPARPATTSRPWNAPAPKSPSTPSTPTPANSTPQPAEQLLALAQPVAAGAGRCRLHAKVYFRTRLVRAALVAARIQVTMSAYVP